MVDGDASRGSYFDLLDELSTTERESALRAFRAIAKLVEHDSPAYVIAVEQAGWLAGREEGGA